jgi:hypothetical protein
VDRVPGVGRPVPVAEPAGQRDVAGQGIGQSPAAVGQDFPDFAGGAVGGVHDAVPVVADEAAVACLGVHDLRVRGQVDLVSGMLGAGADPQMMP